MQQTHFDEWTKIKKVTQHNTRIVYFHPREIWFIRIGENIGFEQSGKGHEFLRPVVILKKFNKRVFWAVLLTTVRKDGRYYFPIENSGGKRATAVLSQVRLTDAKRLRYKIGDVDVETFQNMKKAISEILLSEDSF